MSPDAQPDTAEAEATTHGPTDAPMHAARPSPPDDDAPMAPTTPQAQKRSISDPTRDGTGERTKSPQKQPRPGPRPTSQDSSSIKWERMGGPPGALTCDPATTHPSDARRTVAPPDSAPATHPMPWPAPPPPAPAGAHATTQQPQATPAASATTPGAAANPATPPPPAEAHPNGGDTDTRLAQMLQQVLNNQDKDRQTTTTILDALTTRMTTHEQATQRILTRLDAQETHAREVSAHQDARYNKMNDWGANITMQMHTMNTKIQNLETQMQSQPRPDEETRNRLQHLEARYERDAAANAAASAEAARQAAAGVAEAHLRNSTVPPSASQRQDATTLIISGFGHDRPAEVIERTCRRLLSLTASGARLGFALGTGETQQRYPPATQRGKGTAKGGGPGPTASSSSSSHSASHQRTSAQAPMPPMRVFSPWLLSSQPHLTCETPTLAAQVLEELRAWLVRELLLPNRDGTGPQTPTRIWAGYLKTREDRQRNQRLTTLARALQGHLRNTCPDLVRPPHRNVCWKSATTILGGRRIATLRRRWAPGDIAPPPQTPGTTETTTIHTDLTIDWHPAWWGPDIFEYEQHSIMEAVAQTLRQL